MATVSKALAEKIIAANGYYANDPRVQQVIRYQNAYGGTSYAILYKSDVELDRYAPSDFVINPKLVWEAD